MMDKFKFKSAPLTSWLVISAAATALLAPIHATARGAFDGPGPFVIPAAAFKLNTQGDYFFAFGDGAISSQQGGPATCFKAPAYLPNRFEVGSLVLHASDTSESDLTLELVGNDLDTAEVGARVSVSTQGSSGFQLQQQSPDGKFVVDNPQYAYTLNACVPAGAGPSLRLYAVTILAPEQVYADGFEVPPMCGDGVLDEGEECDDGNLTDDDGCSSSCELPRPSKMAPPVCGDETTNSMLVKFDAPASNGATITGYEVRMATSPDMLYATPHPDLGGSLNREFTGLTPGQVYYFDVWALTINPGITSLRSWPSEACYTLDPM